MPVEPVGPHRRHLDGFDPQLKIGEERGCFLFHDARTGTLFATRGIGSVFAQRARIILCCRNFWPAKNWLGQLSKVTGTNHGQR